MVFFVFLELKITLLFLFSRKHPFRSCWWKFSFKIKVWLLWILTDYTSLLLLLGYNENLQTSHLTRLQIAGTWCFHFYGSYFSLWEATTSVVGCCNPALVVISPIQLSALRQLRNQNKDGCNYAIIINYHVFILSSSKLVGRFVIVRRFRTAESSFFFYLYPYCEV